MMRNNRRQARIVEIAQEAGVGTATVDRVLHGRGGVTDATARRVRCAMATLKAREAPAHAGRGRFDIILPAEAGPSTEALGRWFLAAGRAEAAAGACAFVEKMNPHALADRLLACRDDGSSGVAFQALDHPLVRDAVSRLRADGVPALALMSDLDGSDVIAYVGTDNRAAGRTAGVLMGRFAPGPGKVAILWGGELYRSHEAREIGFRSVVRAEFAHLEVLDLVCGRDDAADNYAQITAVLDRHNDLVGIYSVGGGNRGVVQALVERGRARDIVLIGHNLTSTTQRFLVDGSIDAVIHQDMALAARLAVKALIDYRAGRPVAVERLPVEIVLRENISGRVLAA